MFTEVPWFLAAADSTVMAQAAPGPIAGQQRKGPPAEPAEGLLVPPRSAIGLSQLTWAFEAGVGWRLAGFLAI